jgi:tRNA dimethylallyltransferase
MAKKLLVICGPTATGKTSLGTALARKLKGEIVSADSRQVYKGMDIGTGKEWGKGVKIWGYDLVDPGREFSVAQFLKFALHTISDIQKRKKLPILVGGTGLYIKAVTDGIPTVSIPRNNDLREKLENKSADELYESLSNIDSVKAASLNFSDKKNPRRLIRAIEIVQWKLSHGREIPINSKKHIADSILFIGLSAPKSLIDKRIEDRVENRIKEGIKREIRALLKKGVGWDDQSMMSLGYRQWRDYFEGVIDEGGVKREWEREEKKYAKRQMVWWARDKRIKWFDISSGKYPKNVEKLAEKWYKLP